MDGIFDGCEIRKRECNPLFMALVSPFKVGMIEESFGFKDVQIGIRVLAQRPGQCFAPQRLYCPVDRGFIPTVNEQIYLGKK